MRIRQILLRQDDRPARRLLLCFRVPESSEVTELLLAWQQGSRQALDQLMPLVYGELKAIAGRYLSHERAGHTLQCTSLVHEAYLKLIDQRRVQWQNRAHFFGIAAQMMRRILVDHARAAHREKRGGSVPTLSLDAAMEVPAAASGVDLLVLDHALDRLAEIEPSLGRLVELRYFSGLTIEESAAVLGTSPGTVKREWAAARAWLFREMSPS